MAASDHHPPRVQPGDHLAPIDAQSRVAGLKAAVTDEVAFVVRQLDDPHAEQVEQIEPSDLGTDRHAVLETEDNAKPSTGLRRAQVRTGDRKSTRLNSSH